MTGYALDADVVELHEVDAPAQHADPQAALYDLISDSDERKARIAAARHRRLRSR